MNNLSHSAAQHYEMPALQPTMAQSIQMPNYRYQPNIYSPETDFRSPFQRTMEKVRKGVERAVNMISGAAVGAPIGAILGVTSAAVATAVSGTPFLALPWLQTGAIVGGIKGIFTGNKWFNNAQTSMYNNQLVKEKLLEQVIQNKTADARFENTVLSNESQIINNEIMLDELRLRQEQDPYLIELQKRESELKVAKMEQEQAEIKADYVAYPEPTKTPQQKNYFAELDAMAA